MDTASDHDSLGDPEVAIVAALRRIIRAVDLHSRRLVEAHGLTGPQLTVLKEVRRRGPLTPGAIAASVHLSAATVSGILARLAQREMIERTPSEDDRRSVRITLSEAGERELARAPSLLQERFRAGLRALEPWEQKLILATLERIGSMMDASGLDASPHLITRSEELQGLADEEATGARPDPSAAAARGAPTGARPPATTRDT